MICTKNLEHARNNPSVAGDGVACGPMPGPMERDVDEFVGGIAHELGALSGRPDAEHTADAVIEASNLVAAIIAADGRLTDSELDAYLDSIGPLLDPPLITSASHVRETDLFDRRDEWLAEPSVLFDLLVKADRRDGTRRSQPLLRVGHAPGPRDGCDRSRSVGERGTGDRRLPHPPAPGDGRRRRGAAGPA